MQAVETTDHAVRDPDRETSFWESIREYLDRRLLVIFLNGIASGFPWVIVSSAMTLRLSHADLSRSAIGVFGIVTAAYAWNFAWSPLIDRYAFPGLRRFMGHRRSWILAMQVLLAGATVGMAFADPKGNLALLAALAVFAAFSSATQDVAIDAYRIEVIPREETAKVSHAAAVTTAGWWAGFGFMGSIPFFLIDLPSWNWTMVYLVLAALWLPLMVTVLLAPDARTEPKGAEAEVVAERSQLGVAPRAATWLRETLVEPLAEFVRRTGPRLAWSVMLFVFLFKIGEAFLGRMSIVFYEEIGYTATQMATYSKLVGAGATIVFSILGSIINARFGLIRGLLIGGIAMAASNLMYSWIALVGPVQWLYGVTVVVDGFTSALSTVAFVAFVSYLTSHTYTATQYALLASLGNFGRTTMSAASGFMVDALGGNWALFFVITALMVIPSLLLLVFVSRELKKRVKYWDDEKAAAAAAAAP